MAGDQIAQLCYEGLQDLAEQFELDSRGKKEPLQAFEEVVTEGKQCFQNSQFVQTVQNILRPGRAWRQED